MGQFYCAFFFFSCFLFRHRQLCGLRMKRSYICIDEKPLSRQKAIINNSIKANVQSKLSFSDAFFFCLFFKCPRRWFAYETFNEMQFFFARISYFFSRHFAPVFATSILRTLLPCTMFNWIHLARADPFVFKVINTTHTHNQSPSRIAAESARTSLHIKLASTKCASHSCPVCSPLFSWTFLLLKWIPCKSIITQLFERNGMNEEPTDTQTARTPHN